MNALEVRFRRYSPQDNDAVMKLHVDALRSTNAYIEVDGYYSDLDDISAVYLASGGEFLVGESADGIVAVGGVQCRTDGAAEIRRMRVAPSVQGQGIGRQLLGRLERAAEQRGWFTIKLDTTENQIAAQRLFARSGYREVGRGSKGSALETIFFEKRVGEGP